MKRHFILLSIALLILEYNTILSSIEIADKAKLQAIGGRKATGPKSMG